MDDLATRSDVMRLWVTLAVDVVAVARTAFVFQAALPGRVRAGLGIICFIDLVVACSPNIRAIS